MNNNTIYLYFKKYLHTFFYISTFGYWYWSRLFNAISFIGCYCIIYFDSILTAISRRRTRTRTTASIFYNLWKNGKKIVYNAYSMWVEDYVNTISYTFHFPSKNVCIVVVRIWYYLSRQYMLGKEENIFAWELN